MDEQTNPSDLNRFGEVLQKLMQKRDLDVAELAALVQEAGVPITHEDIEALMTAEPGEEFQRVVDDLEEAVPREN